MKTDIHYPAFSIPMPYNKDWQGPAEPDETVVIKYLVWDQVFQTVCECNSEEDAKYIAKLINKDMVEDD